MDKKEAVMVASDALLEGKPERAKEALKEYYATKPHYTDEEIAKYVERDFARLRPEGPKVGDILYWSGGYEQTRVNFYEVVGVTKASVKIRRIGLKCVRGGYNMPTDADVVPVPGSFVGEAKTTRFNLDTHEGVGYSAKCERGGCYLWDGTPKHESGDH